ncbi:hypothetical protein Tco_0231301 [Tanacetum coccineum]
MDSIIPLGQKNTLAEYMILSGADNRPPMLDKDLYDSWKSRMELYMQNREHGRMILESVEHGPLIWPTIEENGVTRTKKYVELSAAEKIQADCDMKATNIILQGLPADIYSLVNHHRVAKDLWERVQLLMQVNTKFLNSLPPEWSKFVTNVKLVKDLHTTNFDQLHAYLEQHELYANEVRLLRERNQDPLAFVGRQEQNYSGTGYKINDTSSRGTMQVDKQGLLNATIVKDKAMLAEAQEAEQILDEEQLAFLADPGVPDGQVVQTIIPNNACNTPKFVLK